MMLINMSTFPCTDNNLICNEWKSTVGYLNLGFTFRVGNGSNNTVYIPIKGHPLLYNLYNCTHPESFSQISDMPKTFKLLSEFKD